MLNPSTCNRRATAKIEATDAPILTLLAPTTQDLSFQEQSPGLSTPSIDPVATVPTLREYQLRVIRQAYALIRKGIKRIVIYAPTGAGKTVIAAKIILDALSRGRNVLFLVHRDTLVLQTVNTLAKFGITTGVLKAGFKEDRLQLVQIASIQTLARRHIPLADVIICDECHSLSFFAAFDRLLNYLPHAILLGFTATPWRLKKDEGLGSIYEGLVCAPEPSELIKLGYLVPPRYFGYPDLDLSDIKTLAGEFDVAGLEAVCNTPRIIDRMVEEYQRLATSRRAIIFAVSVAHSMAIANAFNTVGIRAEHIDSSTPTNERQSIFERVKKGETLVLSSVGVLTEGFDIPEISCVILARPTKSKALNLQMVGRGLRIAPWENKADCVLLDFANNTKQHGFCTDPQNISLQEPEETEPGGAPVKACPNCDALLHVSVMTCPACGHEFPSAKAKVERTETLIELEANLKQKQFDFYQQKARLAFERGFSPGWAAVRFRDEYGLWPPRKWQRSIVFGGLATDADKQAYRFYLEAIAERLDKSQVWVTQQMAVEFGGRHE
jgi:superfamily II DNA or RNA helicase